MSEANIDKINKNNPAANWAQPVSSLKANVAEKNAPNRVNGKQLQGVLST